jgi:hypothetical protein
LSWILKSEVGFAAFGMDVEMMGLDLLRLAWALCVCVCVCVCVLDIAKVFVNPLRALVGNVEEYRRVVSANLLKIQ